MKKATRLLKRQITADWKSIDISNLDSVLQVLTNAMTYNSPVRIQYQGSGWRTISPYAWNTSQEGNVVVMCYKDTGEIRAYSLDKISNILVDDAASTFDLPQEIVNFEDFEIPQLPEEEKKPSEELPYDQALQTLTTNEVIEETPDKEEVAEDFGDENAENDLFDDDFDFNFNDDFSDETSSDENENEEENGSEDEDEDLDLEENEDQTDEEDLPLDEEDEENKEKGDKEVKEQDDPFDIDFDKILNNEDEK